LTHCRIAALRELRTSRPDDWSFCNGSDGRVGFRVENAVAFGVHAIGAMNSNELKDRCLRFAVAAYKFGRPLLRTVETRHVGLQLIRSSSSVAANYRSACLARTRAEWIAKIGLVREEADETEFWFIFTGLAELPVDQEQLKELTAEACTIAKIVSASYWTSRSRCRQKAPGKRQ
jgi:four helix bundle protein